MKNLLKLFVPMTVAVMSLAACNKEIKTPEPENALHITVKAVQEAIKTDAPKADAPTKTYIDGTTIKWGTGEYMKIGVFDGTATAFGNSTDASADLWNGDAAAMFEFSITPENTTGSYTYYGLYPASAAVASSNTNPAAYKVNLLANQNATASSYDPKAYILVARPESGKTVYAADWDAAFRRATALNHITLTNVPEDVKRITITAPDGTYLAGARHIDLTTGLSGDIYSGGGRTETVEIRYATKLSHESAMNIWFTSWDASIAVGEHLVIVAYSDAHTYTRDITVVNKPITFKEGYLNTLNVNMASAVEGVNNEFDEGNYVVLAKNGGTYYAMKAENDGSDRLVSLNYTGSTSSYNGDADIIWSIAKSGDSYTFKNGTNYLGWTSGNTALLIDEASYDDDNCLMDITYNEGTYLVSSHHDSSRKIARNNSNAYFAFYAGTQYKDLVFVPATVDARAAVTLSFDESVINKTTADYDSFLGQDVTASPSVSAITSNIAWSYVDNDGVIDDFDDGVLTLTGTVGSATVTASFAGDGSYRPAEASYTITVVSAAAPEWVETPITSLGTSDVFVIVGSTGPYAMTNDNGTGSSPGVLSVTVSGTKLSGVIADNIKWNISGNASDGYTFYPNGDDSNWLYYSSTAATGSNDKLRVGTGARKVFEQDGTGYLVTKDTYADRYLSIYNNTDWRGYVNTNNNPQVVKFYKYTENDGKSDAEISFSPASAIITYGEALSQPTLSNTHGLTVSYESSNTGVATVAANGAISVVSAGTTTITCSWDEQTISSTTYRAGSVSFSLTVNKIAVTVVFSDPTTSVGVGSTVTNVATTTPLGLALTYSSSSESVATVSPSGVVSGVAAGVSTITATYAGDATHESAYASYQISVGNANDGSLAHPYTVAEALAIIAGYSDKQKSENEVYVSGIVANVGSYNSTYHSVTYDISDDGANTNTLNIYSGHFVANTNFTSNSQIAVDDEVIVRGYLYLYGTTKEMYQNNYIYSLNGTSKALTAGSLTATPNDSNKQITVTWGAATGTESAISYVVNCGTQSYNANAAGSYTFTMADYGTYNVSVVASASDAFSATASSTATLTDPGSNVPAPVSMNIYSNAATVSGSGVGQTATWTSGDITVTAVKVQSSATAFRSSDTNHTRFYQNWSFSVASAANTISSVVVTCTSDDYANTLSNQTFSDGSASASGSIVTISEIGASSVSVSALGGQVRISSITVNYQ